MYMAAITAEFLDRSMKTTKDTMSRSTRRKLTTMPSPVVEPKLEEFHAHVAAHLMDLRASDGEEEVMSIPWDDEVAGWCPGWRWPWRATKKLVLEFGELAIKVLDFCNAAPRC